MLLALIAGYLLLQVALVLAILRYKARIPHKNFLVAGLFLMLLAWIFTLNDSALLLKIAPNKYAVVLYDLFPLFVTGILSLLSAAQPRNALRYGVYGVLWFCMNFYFFGAAIFIPIHCGNEWSGVCCLQTNDRTCAPAAAATLLTLNGLDATEDEMKRACLTSLNGTSFWGVYHGLRERADAAGKSVVVDDLACDEFIARNEPAIVWVMLTGDVDARDKRYARDWGWTVNVSHAVVFLRQCERRGKLRIADQKLLARSNGPRKACGRYWRSFTRLCISVDFRAARRLTPSFFCGRSSIYD